MHNKYTVNSLIFAYFGVNITLRRHIAFQMLFHWDTKYSLVFILANSPTVFTEEVLRQTKKTIIGQI